MRESHIQPTSEQVSHEHFASTNRANFASVNGGRPATAAVARPMTSSSAVNHAAMNNNTRPAYNNANANNRPAHNANANTRPASSNNVNSAYKAPANNATAPHNSQPKVSEPAHQGGGQPHENGGGGEHEHR